MEMAIKWRRDIIAKANAEDNEKFNNKEEFIMNKKSANIKNIIMVGTKREESVRLTKETALNWIGEGQNLIIDAEMLTSPEELFDIWAQVKAKGGNVIVDNYPNGDSLDTATFDSVSNTLSSLCQIFAAKKETAKAPEITSISSTSTTSTKEKEKVENEVTETANVVDETDNSVNESTTKTRGKKGLRKCVDHKLFKKSYTKWKNKTLSKRQFAFIVSCSVATLEKLIKEYEETGTISTPNKKRCIVSA